MPFIDENGQWVDTGHQAPVRPGSVPIQRAPGAAAPATPAVGTDVAPGTLQVGGSSPDYKSLIMNDPSYVAWRASAGQRRTGLADSRAATIRALVLHHGGLPPGFQDAFGDLRAEDLAAAGQNQFSDVAQLERNYQQGVEQMHRALAARGGLQSGELNYGQEQADYARAANEYQSNSDFGSQLNQAINDFTSNSGAVDAEEPGVIGSAETNAYQNYKPTGAHPAQLLPDSVKTYGYALYKDDAGRFWRIDPTSGQPVDVTGNFAPGTANPSSPNAHTPGGYHPF